MRHSIIHSIVVCLAAFALPFIVACSSQEESLPDTVTEAALYLNVSTLEQSRSGETANLPDNELMADENINYRPWDIQSVEAGIGKDDTGVITNVKGLVADFTVGRLIETHHENMILTITTREGKTVARIPVIDYALMGKEYYEKEYNYPMDKREFLDRLDECVMTLFLDENHTWVSSVIQILSWRVVLSNVEVE